LFFPVGFYLPFFVQRMAKFKIYSVVVAASIIVIEIMQLATKSGSLDIDNFILNFAGALIGLVVFTRTPLRRLLELRAW
jgi:glycopeptide antibiotics resistance protein